MDKWLIAKNTVGAAFITAGVSSAITEAQFDALSIPSYTAATMKSLFGKWKRVMRVILSHCRNRLNAPPTVANALVDQSVARNASLSYQFAINSFASTKPITYVLVEKPLWVNWDPATRTFTGTAPGVTGVHTITVRATDAFKGAVDDTFTVTVT
jgi:hypothetical protein